MVSPTIRPRTLVRRAGKPQGDLMDEGVWDCGKSEGLPVIGDIGVQDLPRRESAPTSTWCNRRETTARVHESPEGMHLSLRGDVRPRRINFEEESMRTIISDGELRPHANRKTGTPSIGVWSSATCERRRSG